jgi:hypothetical protein
VSSFPSATPSAIEEKRSARPAKKQRRAKPSAAPDAAFGANKRNAGNSQAHGLPLKRVSPDFSISQELAGTALLDILAI